MVVRCVIFALLTLVFGVVPGVSSDRESEGLAERTLRHPAMSRWVVDGAVGVRLWDLSGEPAEHRAYLEQSQVGAVLGIDVSVFPWGPYGLGITHSRFHATASDDDLCFPDNSRRPAKDDFTVHYVGPSFYMSHPLAKGQASLVGQVGLGWLFYRSESTIGAFPGICEGTTLGLHAAVSADYRILPWFGIGAGVRLIHGTLEGVHYNAMETSIPALSLTRVDVAAGLRFYP
jgi:hypothetical protein